jgi:hypothetical protein
MSVLWRLFGDTGDPKRQLARELASLKIDWPAFRDRAVHTLRLLGLSVPCATFAARPSPETLAETMDALLTTDPSLAVEFREVSALAGLEELLLDVMDSARRSQSPYLVFSEALPRSVIQYLDTAKETGSRIPQATWVAAYLSACNAAQGILPLQDACRALAVHFGLQYDPAARTMLDRLGSHSE